MNRPLRIGAVNYLNARPLVEGLEELLPDAEVVYAVPSRLAEQLAQGKLDVALAPCIELARRPQWQILSNACIGCRGPVLSVKLLFRSKPEQVRTLAVDEGSRTSVVLAQVLLAGIAGVQPKLVELPLSASPESIAADAVLVIGDRAIRPPTEGFSEAWDLGDRWCRWSELPLAFAAWIVPGDISVLGGSASGLEAALERSRDLGLERLDAIADRHARAMGLPLDLVTRYLRRHLNYFFDNGERRGLELYFQRAYELGLLAPNCRLKIDDCSLKH